MLSTSTITSLAPLGPTLLDAMVKGLVVLMLAGIVTLCMRRAAAAARHAVWSLAMAALLLVPVLSGALPGWRVLPSWASLPPDLVADVSEKDAVPKTPAPIDNVAVDQITKEAMADGGPYRPVVADEKPIGAVGRADAASPPSSPVSAEAPQIGESREARTSETIVSFVVLIWVVGAIVALVPLGVGRVILWRLARNSHRVEADTWVVLLRRICAQLSLKRQVVMLESDRRAMPMVWGVFRPKLLLPNDASSWSAQRRRIVLLHEVAHLKRWDCLTKTIAQLACALYWFNPLVWMALRWMQRESERACDDVVLSAGDKPSDYAEHILHIASSLQANILAAHSGIAMARKSKLEGRLLAILDSKRNRRALTRIGALTAAILLACVVVPVSIVRATGRGEAPAASAAEPAGEGDAPAGAAKSGEARGMEAVIRPGSRRRRGSEKGEFEQNIRWRIDRTTPVRLVHGLVIEGLPSTAFVTVPWDYGDGISTSWIDLHLEIKRSGERLTLKPSHTEVAGGKPRTVTTTFNCGIIQDAEFRTRSAKKVSQLDSREYITLWEGKIEGGVPENGNVVKKIRYVARVAPPDEPVTRFFSRDDPVKEIQPLPVAPEKPAARPVGSKLALCIVSNVAAVGKYPPMLSPETFQECARLLEEKGPGMGGKHPSYWWAEVGGGIPGEALVGTYEGKEYVLLCNGPVLGMVPTTEPAREYALVRVKATKDPERKPAVEFELDKRGKSELGRITGWRVGLSLAVVVDGEVLMAPRIDEPWTGVGVITGNFTQQQAQQLADALRLGMPAVNAMRDAVQEGNPKRVKELLDANPALLEAPPNWPSFAGRPLHTAAEGGHKAVVELLLDRGADIDAPSRRHGLTPLHVAVRRGRKEMVELLLGRGADVHTTDKQGFTPLHTGVGSLHKDIAEALIAAGADVDARGKVGVTPLLLTIMTTAQAPLIDSGKVQEVARKAQEMGDLLVRNGAKLDIFTATALGKIERVEEFLSADPNAIKAKGLMQMTPLHFASFMGQEQVAKLLVERGADVNGEGGLPPLAFAAGMGHVEIVRLLLAHKADVHARAEGDETCLHWAAYQGRKEVVGILLDHGAEVNPKAPGMNPPLNSAAKGGQKDVAELLLLRGADVNAKGEKGRTALIELAQATSLPHTLPARFPEKATATAKVLIDRGADVNSLDKNGSTALVLATGIQFSTVKINAELVQLLVDSGANVNVTGATRSTPLHFAAERGDTGVVKILLAAGADRLAKDSMRQTPLEVAEKSPKGAEAAKILREYKAPDLGAIQGAVQAAARKFLKAVRDGDDKGIAEVTFDHPDYPAGIWTKWVGSLRKEYAGQFDRFDRMLASSSSGGWADRFVLGPKDAKYKYLVLILMEFPDGKWRVVQLARETGEAQNRLGTYAAQARRRLRSLRNALYDAAGKTSQLPVLDSTGGELPQGISQIHINVIDGNLRLRFSGQHPRSDYVIEVQKELVKRWAGKDDLALAKVGKWTRGDLVLEAGGAKATLSGDKGKITIDVDGGEVRVRRENTVIAGPRIVIDLQTLTVEPDKTAATGRTQRKMDFRVVHKDTKKPIRGAKLRVRTWGILIGEQKSYMETDEQGRARIPLPSEDPKYFSVRTSVDGFVPIVVSWSNSRQRDPIPEEYTLGLQRGTSIGGIVRNEDGEPIPGVKVRLMGASGRGREQVGIINHVVKTDRQGRWRCDIMPPHLDDLHLCLQHDDYAGDDHFGQRQLPPTKQLRDMTAVMVMVKGFVVTGRVLDATGLPIAGASVKQGRRLGSFFPETFTDGKGWFRFSRIKLGETTFSVQEPGHAPDIKTVTVGKATLPIEFRLSPGRVIRGRVVDEKGLPIPGASVRVRSWRGYEFYIMWNTSTDSQGRFRWMDAPRDEVCFDIGKSGYVTIMGRALIASDEEHVIKLLRPLRLRVHGEVRDAETGEPIEKFGLIPGVDRGGGRISWERAWGTRIFTGGGYEIELEERDKPRCLRIEAKGYKPSVSRTILADEGEVTIDFKLEKGADIAGVVLGVDGKPLSDAKVVVCTRSGGNLVIEHNRLTPDQGAGTVTTGPDGSFSFSPQAEPYHLVVMHENGFAQVSEKQFDPSHQIPLQPWSRIEGTLMIGPIPGANRRISAERLHRFVGEYYPARFRYEVPTDANGRFVVERVPPGKVWIGEQVRAGPRSYMIRRCVLVKLEAGRTATVTIGGTGRPVIARIGVPKPVRSKIDWSDVYCFIMPQTPEGMRPPYPENWHELTYEQKHQWRLAWGETDEGKAYHETIRTRPTYRGKVGEDGTFRVEDVPPGKYELHLVAHGSPRPDGEGPRDRIGDLTYKFTVPEILAGRSDEPLDLRKLQLKIYRGLKVGDKAPLFETNTLDREPLRLADYRGKYVLLDFWGNLGKPFDVRTHHLKGVYDAFNGDERFVMVSLSVDRDVREPKSYVRRHGLKWIQGFLGDQWNTVVRYEYGVCRPGLLPLIMLIGPDGKVLAKDLRGEGIRTAVEKTLAKP